MIRLIKRFTATFIVISILLSLCIKANAVEFSISAKSAILINASTNEIVYEKNAYEQRGMASTTKIMTAILAIERANLQKTVVARNEEVRIEGTSIGLKAGDKITLETLVCGMLLESGNDAANVTARVIGKSREKFVSLMNQKAKEIGMENTCFKNPSGLTEDGHFSTAFDMALLGSYAIKNKQFRDICSLSTLRVVYGNPQYQRTFKNHNKLLNSVEGAFGIKTGFTKASGRCLVSAAERNGVTLIAVTLSAPDDWNDHKKLFEYGFEKVKVYENDFNAEEIRLDVVGSDNKRIGVKLKNKLIYTALDEEVNPQIVVLCEKFLYSEVKIGDRVGCVKVYSDDEKLLCESDLISTENASMNFLEKEKKPSILDKIKDLFNKTDRKNYGSR